jgi:hypothetical protein
MRLIISAAVTGLMSAPAFAGSAAISIDIPRLNVAEYHRPYVAFWVESKDGAKVENLAVWYDLKLKDGEGNKWLKDMRQWWRRTGRELTMPMDGLSTPTRPPGTHKLTFETTTKPLAGLSAGEYVLVVEAAREVGGRELLRLPFQWPPAAPATIDAKGEHELGAITLTLTP